jgi:4-hydroxyphenylpyruvate dioxygenase
MDNNTDFLPLNGTDHIELYVGNALQSAYFYQVAFGFQPFAYKGLSTGSKNSESYVLKQDKVILVLTTPLVGGTEMGKHIDLHGDGVKSIALWVDDATSAYNETIKRGAISNFEPHTISDENGSVVLSSIKLYGDTIHVFVDRSRYNGVFLPGYKAYSNKVKSEPVGFKYIDHMVANVNWGEMNHWVDFYKNVMGFNQLISFDDKDISTEYTALMSKVMSNGNGRIKFPINEPAEGKKKSQIEEYLDFYGGSGVQHVAIATDDILQTVSTLQARGIEFLTVPQSYYDVLLDRVGTIDEDLKALAALGILVDRDDEGYLLQIFTKPLESRPTLFFEIIQRKGAKSFGKGNFKALFESIEREQAIRGTL